MLEKIQSCIEEINLEYLTEFAVTNESPLEELQKVLSYLEGKCKSENITFVHGIGKLKSKLQKQIEALKKFSARREKYDPCNQLFEGRNTIQKPTRMQPSCI